MITKRGKMRAPKTEATGTSGQSFVKGEFEEMGWGAVPNPEHDLGTDLWLMARDENRFDLGALVGAQVKTGASYFTAEEVDGASGEVTGWWYAESDDSHFDYWSEHTTPHILVLRNPRTKQSYWAHVTSDAIQSTGQGNKILVPASQLVNEENRIALTSVATSPAKAANLDGSAWGATFKISSSYRLRYALVAPRLVAPHPNKGPMLPDPTEAIAMLVQGRFSELQVVRAEKRKAIEGLAEPTSPLWQVFDAIWSWAIEGSLLPLDDLPDTTDDLHAAATAIARAAAYVEYGRPDKARVAVEAALRRPDLGTVDRAWLKMHDARCLVEMGKLEEARYIALEVQQLRSVAPSDPTAAALVAASTILIFETSNLGTRDVGELVESIDTSTHWWRSQTIARGLERHFDQQFKAWGRDATVTWGAADTAWASLRSATLLAGMSADHTGWQHTLSLLARRELMKATKTDPTIIRESLKDLLRAGARKELDLAARKYRDDGPVEPMTTLIATIDLASETRSSLQAALSFLRHAGDFADSGAADRHVGWLIASLEDPTALMTRLHPRFYVMPALTETLAGLIHSSSVSTRRRILDHVLQLPAIEDQSLARNYGRIVAILGHYEWSTEDIGRLAARTGDNWELQDDISAVVAENNPAFRSSLLEKIRDGNLTALASFGRVDELPEADARGAIASLALAVSAQISQAQKGGYAMGGSDLGEALTLLNACHPDVARWDTLESLLTEPKSHPSHIHGALRVLATASERIPLSQRARLKPILEAIGQREEYDGHTFLIPGDFSPQSVAKLALLRMFPQELQSPTMQTLLRGGSDDRQVAATLAAERRRPGDEELLISLTRAPERCVRLAALVGIAEWTATGDCPDNSVKWVATMTHEEGPVAAKHVSKRLLGLPPDPARDALLRSLVEHPSAIVRATVAAALDDAATSSVAHSIDGSPESAAASSKMVGSTDQ